MSREMDERTESLLGKYLLGRASPEEIRELKALRGANAALRSAMDAARGSAADFRRCAAGEDVRLTPDDLPDYLRPQELARGLERWFGLWVLVSAGSAVATWIVLLAAAVNIVPTADLARSARIIFVCGGVTLAVVVAAAWFARERLASSIASGGPSWERAVAAVRRQEEWFLSPLGTSMMLLGACIAATAFVVAGSTPRPVAGYALLVATAGLVLALRIAKRRFLLRGLRGGRDRP